MTDRDRLLRLLRERSLTEGEFVLSSGERSSYYIDARRTTMSGLGQLLIGRVGLAALDAAGWTPAAVGGLTLGADPIAYAIAHTASLADRRLDAFTVRKRPKDHGTSRRVEGPFERGMEVVVVEDVVTTGESVLRAVDVVRAEGGSVAGVLALVDRGEGGRERITGAGLAFQAVFTAAELRTTTS